MVAISECGCSMTRGEFVSDRRGVAPCGATYGTAAGPNDGVTACGVCGVVHPRGPFQ
jgi:hypothetical protein